VEPVVQAHEKEPPFQFPQINLQEAFIPEEFSEDQLMDDLELACKTSSTMSSNCPISRIIFRLGLL
jgi:hypothetical protein